MAPQSRLPEAYLRELRDRAALLMRLNHDAEYVKMRLRGNVSWDFELSGGGGAYGKEVDELVDAVFGRSGAATRARKAR